MATSRRTYLLYLFNHRTKEGGFLTHMGKITTQMTRDVYLDKDEALSLASTRQSGNNEIVLLRTFL